MSYVHDKNQPIPKSTKHDQYKRSSALKTDSVQVSEASFHEEGFSPPSQPLIDLKYNTIFQCENDEHIFEDPEIDHKDCVEEGEFEHFEFEDDVETETGIKGEQKVCEDSFGIPNIFQ